jgi:hypothetical protein
MDRWEAEGDDSIEKPKIRWPIYGSSASRLLASTGTFDSSFLSELHSYLLCV